MDESQNFLHRKHNFIARKLFEIQSDKYIEQQYAGFIQWRRSRAQLSLKNDGNSEIDLFINSLHTN